MYVERQSQKNRNAQRATTRRRRKEESRQRSAVGQHGTGHMLKDIDHVRRNQTKCPAYNRQGHNGTQYELQSIAGIKKTEIWGEGPFLRVSYAAKRPEGLFLNCQTPNHTTARRHRQAHVLWTPLTALLFSYRPTDTITCTSTARTCTASPSN